MFISASTRQNWEHGFMKGDVILAGQGSSHSSCPSENKLSLLGMLTLNAFTGAGLLSAVILQQAMILNSFIHAFTLC